MQVDDMVSGDDDLLDFESLLLAEMVQDLRGKVDGGELSQTNLLYPLRPFLSPFKG